MEKPTLLERYMALIIAEEGTAYFEFLAFAFSMPDKFLFTEEEKEELRAVEKRVRKEIDA